MRNLAGKVAVVTGGSRGAGRGIALELGAAGATVYVSGRSRVGRPAPGYGHFLAQTDIDEMPGTIDETAAAVTEAGGVGIPVYCDHTQPADVDALFNRVESEHGRLDILVNNAWGGHRYPIRNKPFWKLPLGFWEGMFTAGVRNHILASQMGVLLMLPHQSGLIITTTFWDEDRYTGHLFYDLAKAGMNRLAFDMAQDLREHNIASIALSPGWMRTELVLERFGTDEAHWQEVDALAQTESPRYIGRAVVALADDPDVMVKTGQILKVGALARAYGFCDIDGRQPAPYVMT